MLELSLNDIKSHPIHDVDFLDWVQYQTETISKFSEVVTRLDNGQEAIGIALINKCLASYVKFSSIQVAFLQIYKKKWKIKKGECEDLFDRIYRDIKARTVDSSDEIGKRYLKKGATQEEIRKESISHPEWKEYVALANQVEDLELKIEAQRRYISIVEKLDVILPSLKKEVKDVKYLYLE